MVTVEMRSLDAHGTRLAITVFLDAVPVQRIVTSVGYKNLENGKILPCVKVSIESPGTQPRLALVENKS